jgi:hypothetical protein
MAAAKIFSTAASIAHLPANFGQSNSTIRTASLLQ